MSIKSDVISLSQYLKRILRNIFVSFVVFIQFFWALLILFVEWGWHPLSELLAYFSRFAWVARLEKKIENLPPYPALFIFLVPLGILFPIKLLALWMLVHGYLVVALGSILVAKVFATAVLAHTFRLTKDKIMLIGWFAFFCNSFISWKRHIFLILRNSIVWQLSRSIKENLLLWSRDVQVWVKALF